MSLKSLQFAAIIIAIGCGKTTAAQEGVWRPYLDLGAQAGGLADTGQGNLFLPILQDDSQLLFADLRGQWTDIQSAEGNWGLAYRKLVDDEWIFGWYGFYDLRHSQFGNNFSQATFGAEVLTVNWGARLNTYLPEDKVGSASGLNGAFLEGNNIVIRNGEERAYHGIDFEIERVLWRSGDQGYARHLESELHVGNYRHATTWLGWYDAEIWAAAGAFHFDNDVPGFKNMTGPRLRTELRLYDLPLVGPDSRLVLGGQYQYDDVRGSVGTAMVSVRIPFGSSGWRGNERLSPLDRRMVTPIVRDVDVVTHRGSGASEQAAFVGTGQKISSVVIVDANTPDAEAAIEAAGQYSVVIADGASGLITAAGTIDMPLGQLLMGGGSSVAFVGTDTGTVAVFTAPGSRATITGGSVTLIDAATNGRIQGLDLQTTLNISQAIYLINDTNVLIDDVIINTSGANGYGILTDGTSQFTLANSTINTSGSTGFGIYSLSNSQFTVNDSVINTSDLYGRGIHSHHNSQYVVNNSTFNTSGQSAVGILSYENSQYVVNNSTFNTSGTIAYGIQSTANSLFSANNSTFNTAGYVSYGIYSANNSQYTLNNSTISTTANASHGIFSTDNSRYTVNGGSISVTEASSRGVFARSTAGNTQTLLFDGVAINGGVYLDGVTNDVGAINATITGSTIVSSGGFPEIDVAADGTATICLSAFDNMLNGGSGSISLNEIGASSIINVTQGAPASGAGGIDTLNGIPATSVVTPGGAIDYDQPACPTP